jgi:hypothetical protein
MTIVALALLALPFGVPQDGQADETVSYGNVLVRVPAGWTHEKREEGLFLRPGDLQPTEAYVVIVPPGGRADGNLSESLEKAWKQVAGAKRIVKKAPGRELKTEGGAPGLMSVGLMEGDDGIRVITSLSVFKCADRTEAVLALTAQDAVFQRYSEALGSLLKGLRFKNTELPSYDLLLAMGYTEKEGKTTVYVLFKDGTWLSLLPPEGLDDLDAAAAKKRYAESCGTHETKDGVMTLRRGARVETFRPTGEAGYGYRSAENAVFQRLPTSTGFRFEGKYVEHGGEVRMAFKADGAFEETSGGASKAGAYEILNNTMWLTRADAGSRKLSFVALPKAGDKNPEFILLGGRWFRRE